MPLPENLYIIISKYRQNVNKTEQIFENIPFTFFLSDGILMAEDVIIWTVILTLPPFMTGL